MRDHVRREVVEQAQQQDAGAQEHAEDRDRFTGGRAPPVQQGFGDQAGTASLAYEEDSDEKELKQKVAALVDKKFGGDFQKAFSHYDRDSDGGISKGELVELLADAKVANGLTRGIWASRILDRLDASADRKIQWLEFETVFKATA